MAYALMAVAAVRDLYRHVAKMMGWEPRYRPMRNHAFNAVFAFSVLLIALGNWAAWRPLATTGWFVCGAALLGGTTVPCGWAKVNNTKVLWYLRQLFFIALGVSAIVYAARML